MAERNERGRKRGRWGGGCLGGVRIFWRLSFFSAKGGGVRPKGFWGCEVGWPKETKEGEKRGRWGGWRLGGVRIFRRLSFFSAKGCGVGPKGFWGCEVGWPRAHAPTGQPVKARGGTPGTPPHHVFRALKGHTDRGVGDLRPPRWGGVLWGGVTQGCAPLHPGLSPCAALRRGAGRQAFEAARWGGRKKRQRAKKWGRWGGGCLGGGRIFRRLSFFSAKGGAAWLEPF